LRLLRRLTDSDMLGGTPVLMDSISRYGSRGVLVNNELNIAMMFMSQLNLYKLPGGGVEEGENKEEAFLRKIKEETGCEAEIIHELGYIEEHKNRNDYMQYSYCFIASVLKYNDDAALSENEINLGMEVKWMSLDKALELMNNSVQNCDDYSTKFMLLRDKTILEEAVNVLNYPYSSPKNRRDKNNL
jgi:8-oxo-dGTP diphosphatase